LNIAGKKEGGRERRPPLLEIEETKGGVIE